MLLHGYGFLDFIIIMFLRTSHGLQALSIALPGDASVYLLLGMLRTAKDNKEDAANAYAAAVRISLVSLPYLPP